MAMDLYTYLMIIKDNLSVEKTDLRGFQVRHKLACTVTELEKMARGLKFRIYEEEELYYPCSQNKGTDQLCSYCEADLCLCFPIGKKSSFLMTRLP